MLTGLLILGAYVGAGLALDYDRHRQKRRSVQQKAREEILGTSLEQLTLYYLAGSQHCEKCGDQGPPYGPRACTRCGYEDSWRGREGLLVRSNDGMTVVGLDPDFFEGGDA